MSYAQTDVLLAARVAHALRSYGSSFGFEIWDDWGPRLGESITDIITRALEESNVMVALLTPAAAHSDNFRFEVEYAIGASNLIKRVVPVVVGDFADYAGSEIHRIFYNFRTVRLENPEAEHPNVKQIVEGILGRPVKLRSKKHDVDENRVPNEIFLSHSCVDHSFVTTLADVLRDHGVPVWYSATELRGAQLWQKEIGKALERCDWFALVVSPDAADSMWVRREVQVALTKIQYDEKIVPILYKSCDTDKLSWTLPIFEKIDFSEDFDAGCRELLSMWGIGYSPSSKP